MTDLDCLLDQIEEKQKMEGQIQLSTDATSLDLLQAIYRDNRQPLQRRMRAAIACLLFERPKFAVVVQTTTKDLAVRMQQALEARMKIVNAWATEVKELPKPVETKPVSEAQQVSEEHMKRPMTTLNTNRFRRL